MLRPQAAASHRRVPIPSLDSPPSHCSGTLSYPEFERLLATLEQWTNLFQSADKDRSGKLSIAGE